MRAVTIFGSNTGDRFALIESAVRRLASRGGIVADSSFYETEPWGFECEDYFLNRVTVFETPLSPVEFLHFCLDTERELGRVRQTGGARYSSRPIDIDLLFCDGLVMESEELTLPHPRLCERNFVLAPLAEIMPNFIHPVNGRSIAELAAACPDGSAVKRVVLPNR
ncbi:MAG: 2-amino-4-hydroxy-6-hydroxymethyldihydropteridine diphosphokinase [Odoribacter sp.]|nr:2-amino-4-hydroxy-6-hydroxymethyldihydropteridine diphosphokinase [Odoribacter sp.]